MMNNLKKTLLATTLLSVCGIANAVVTTGQLSFNFSGVIPAAPVVTGTLEFETVTGAPYVPTAIVLETVSTDAGFTLRSNTAENFRLTTSATSFSATAVTAQLLSSVVAGSGIKAGVTAPTLGITINGMTLTATAQAIGTPVASSTSHNVAMTAEIQVPTAAVNTAGGNVTANAAVVFAVDINA
ncbi:hypothetical protein HWQ46_26660 [Shewanella sp. D64]|uniref:hypothetical protein n=1 Tax=unclassified Shewanella TaxID=196818 RepID=UPI0022BA1326|nr:MULTISPECIES: hypothetical protein [unclassified Shewanella]MEC4729091.1 hypothetical protein [Shewanella sp. D64]MEC4740889.1 hypothetical protein [Shewanella sp. E94]WBJ94790.1 hypothetical protein HWQ47_23550 [Shewanella sp. MTB7]WBJ97152.1 hypothetical protein HWQ47_08650 [Shewanella sp. MTB7]